MSNYKGDHEKMRMVKKYLPYANIAVDRKWFNPVTKTEHVFRQGDFSIKSTKFYTRSAFWLEDMLGLRSNTYKFAQRQLKRDLVRTGIKSNRTIESVVRDGLCTGCGTCVGICPMDAIEMVIDHRRGIYLPYLDKEKCDQCGICFHVCPGHAVDFKQLNQEIFGKEPRDALFGNYLNCYIGHATDYDIRYNSASGGLVTALLIFALDEGIIDGALVTKMRKDRPLEPQPFIARTREEIISAAKSKYCPVSANIALKEILKEEGRFAVVGLPCHIQGIRKAEIVNKRLKEKIALHFGILGMHTDSFSETEFILQKYGIRKELVAQLDYRGQGWPGTVTIHLKDGTAKSIPYLDYITLHGLRLFTPRRCNLCRDMTSELADVAFMDPWLPEVLAHEKTGKSLIMPRTKVGKAICQSAKSKKVIEMEEIASSKAAQAQGGLEFPTKEVKVMHFLFRILGHPTPSYNYDTPLLRPGLANYLRALVIYFNEMVSSKSYLRGFISPLCYMESHIFRIVRFIASRRTR